MFTAFALFALALLGTHHYWSVVFEGEKEKRWQTWMLRGLVTPCAVWLAINLRLIPGMAILDTAVPRMKGGAPPLLVVVSLMPTYMVIATFWAAASFAWMASVVEYHTRERSDFWAMSGFLGLIILPISILTCRYTGWAGVGAAVALPLVAIVHFNCSFVTKAVLKPTYTAAVAKMKSGKYAEAEAEVIRQLEAVDDDFDGWFMLADLYANHFNDLAEADATIRSLCEQENISEVQLSIALHKLADWHLEKGRNPSAAIKVLKILSQKVPGSHIARMAELRIKNIINGQDPHLPRLEVKKMALPSLHSELEEIETARPKKLSSEEAMAQANQLVGALTRNPNDIKRREMLATLYAEELGRPDLGRDQLELLLAFPGQSEVKMAEWLSLIAAWELRYNQAWDAARPFLERIILEYPQSIHSFAAQRQLGLREMETRLRGSRERNAGRRLKVG